MTNIKGMLLFFIITALKWPKIFIPNGKNVRLRLGTCKEHCELHAILKLGKMSQYTRAPGMVLNS